MATFRLLFLQVCVTTALFNLAWNGFTRWSVLAALSAAALILLEIYSSSQSGRKG